MIHSFGANGAGVGDGDLVISGLTPDGHGNLFGVTYYGGAYAAGTVYELSPPAQGQTAWTETIIHSFQPFVTTDGSFPTAGVTFDRSGNLYGTAALAAPAISGSSMNCLCLLSPAILGRNRSSTTSRTTITALPPQGATQARWRS